MIKPTHLVHSLTKLCSHLSQARLFIMGKLHRVPRFALLFGVALALSPSTASAQSVTIVKVEEDWELRVGTPDSNSIAPQVTSVLSPTGNYTSLYGTFDVNHRSYPSFSGGGLQLQLWDTDATIAAQDSNCNCVMSTASDTVSWTQSMSLANGQLVLQVTNGSSSTWGSFGNGNTIQLSTASNLSNLNGYDPEFSVNNSGVGYAANRVQTLVLKEVRLITDNGEVLKDSSPRVVFPKS